MVDQSTLYRWLERFLPLLGDVARQYGKLVSPDWRVDEMYARREAARQPYSSGRRGRPAADAPIPGLA